MTIGLSAFSATNGYNGPGTASQSDLESLTKALQAGYQVGSGKTGGSALRVESLEASLKVVTYSSSHIKLWKKIPKTPAYSTVEEYNQLSDYGGSATPWVGEGELPQASDSSYTRRMQFVKFLGTVREVTHQASLVHPASGDLIALENQNGILYLLRQIEKSLFTGDSSLAFDGEAEQWDGLDSLIDSTSVLDLEGNSLQEADIEEASNTIIENYGFPTDMFLGTRNMSDLTKTLYPRQRIAMPAPVNGKAGMTVSSIATQGGDIELCPDVFIRSRPAAPSAATSVNAPATPASIVAALDGAATNGDHEKGAPAGTTNFAYVVTAANRFGESAPTAVPGAVMALTTGQKSAGNSVTLTVTNPGAIGAYPPEFFKIYRSVSAVSATVPAALASYSHIMSIPASSQAAAGTSVTKDLNLYLPFTSTAYMGELTPSVLTFRQLLPMMKMDLAVLSPAYRWQILLYGTPLMFAPKKWIRLINVGQLSTR
jgi:hypothetical protein